MTPLVLAILISWHCPYQTGAGEQAPEAGAGDGQDPAGQEGDGHPERAGE